MGEVIKFGDFVLNESYMKDESEYKNKYDYEFGRYALDERPLFWSDEEMDECRALYGGQNIGTAYHGNRIKTADQLKTLETIKAKLDSGQRASYRMGLKSVSPDYNTALSFALYVKSYDTGVMLQQLAAAMKQGSSGAYGAFVITVEPKPEQVILCAYRKLGHKLTSTAEEEAIVNGEIEVTNIEIYYPLQKDNYLEHLEQLSPFALFNDFYASWMKSNKIPRPDAHYITAILNKLKTEDEAVKFMIGSTKAPFVFGQLQLDEFLSVPIFQSLLKYVKFDKTYFTFQFGGVSIGLGIVDGLTDYVLSLPQFRKMFDIEYSALMKNEYRVGMTGLDRGKGKAMYAYMYLEMDSNARSMLLMVRTYRSLNVKKTPPVVLEMSRLFDKLYTDYIIGKSLKEIDEEELRTAVKILQETAKLSRIGVLPLLDTTKIKEGCQWYYHHFAHRFSGSKKGSYDNMMRYYSEGLKYCMTTLYGIHAPEVED